MLNNGERGVGGWLATVAYRYNHQTTTRLQRRWQLLVFFLFVLLAYTLHTHDNGGDQINVHRQHVRVERLRAYFTCRGVHVLAPPPGAWGRTRRRCRRSAQCEYQLCEATQLLHLG